MPKVEQSDRDAAADLLAKDLGEPFSPADLFQLDGIRTGLDDDDHGVQAFAAHREAAVLAERERCANIAEAMKKNAGGEVEGPYYVGGYWDACQDTAYAIRSGAHKEDRDAD